MRLLVAIFSIAVFLSACGLEQRIGGRGPSLSSIPKGPHLEGEAKAAIKDRQFIKAIENYETLVQSDPRNMKYRIALADTKRMAGKYEDALLDFNSILRDKPDNVDAIEGRGLVYVQQGKFTEAKAILLRVLEKDALRWKSVNALGIIHSVIGQHKLAMDYYTSALQLSDDNPVVMNNAGLGYAFLKDYRTAINTLNRASIRAVVDPAKLKRVDLNLSLVYGISGQQKQAENILRKYFDEPQVYNNLGIYSHLANDNDLAFTYLNKALTSSEGIYEEAWDNLERIKPLMTKE